jgi:hypothetical protein
MRNPWLDIPLGDYEAHMALPTFGPASIRRRIPGRSERHLGSNPAAELCRHKPASLLTLLVDRPDLVIGLFCLFHVEPPNALANLLHRPSGYCVAPTRHTEGVEMGAQAGHHQLHRLRRNLPDESQQSIVVQLCRRIVQQ